MPEEKPLVRELRARAERLCADRGWKMLASLGAGATAAVYEIETCAGLRSLKIYSPRYLKGRQGEVARSRLQLVLDHLSKHTCRNLVKIYDGGEENGVLFLLMERVPGNALGDVLHLVPVGHIRLIIRQVASAAQYLEEVGLCHRDIKSDNIVVSDDYSTAVLLDLGVVRWLDEDGGAGTDREGQLPFVATAQYSSPEYMFRLIPPGPTLWRALTFYQLGGVIHDLVTRKRLFADIAEQAKDNRYLVAYAVATKVPRIAGGGAVPLDLVALAQRALDKNPDRRLGSVSWSDFLSQDAQEQNEAILGIGRPRVIEPRVGLAPPLALSLRHALDGRLTKMGVHCRHDTKVLDGQSAKTVFTWRPELDSIPHGSEISVTFLVRCEDTAVMVDAEAALYGLSGSAPVRSIGPSITLPPEDCGACSEEIGRAHV